MLAESRDIVSVIFLEKRLGALRERFMEKTIAGDPPGDDYWETGEQSVMAEMRQRFYGPEAAKAMAGSDPREETGEETGFEGRTQILSEQAVTLSHRALALTGFVGQPGFEDT